MSGASRRDAVRPPALRRYVEGLPTAGTFSVWAGPLHGPPVLANAAEVPHYAASTMKLALVIAAYRMADRGELDLGTQVAVHDGFRSVAGGRFTMDRAEDSDQEPWRRLGTEVSLRWLAHRAIVRSSNLATNLLLDAVGLAEVGAVLAAVEAARSVVRRGIEDVAASAAGVQNLVTAADLAATLQALAAGACDSPGSPGPESSRRPAAPHSPLAPTIASPAACAEILDVLAAQQIKDALPRGLPAGTRVAHKSGWVDGISHDAGIVYPPDAAPFVLVVCTSSDLSDQQALDVIAAGAAAAWEDRRLLG